MEVRGLSRSAAEIAAFENTVVNHLNATFPDTLSDRCAHCGKRETSDAILLPIGAGARHAWLHQLCRDPWADERRPAAVAELAAMGIAAPAKAAQ
jgi:hypothetical protein